MTQNCYEVLGLSGPASSYDDADIKAAYKKALLLHHPDKSKTWDNVPLKSVDDISKAYKVLSDKSSRAEHDRELLVLARESLGNKVGNGHTGLETVDLDDLEFAEASDGKDDDAWEKSCRCGRRYRITERQLEQEADKGELYVPCEGCSLWLKVLFQTSDDI